MAKKRNVLDCFGLSDLGLKRSTNQDHFLVATLHTRLKLRHGNLPDQRRATTGGKQGHLLIVADGMGGMAEGGTASRVVVQAFLRSACNGLTWTSDPKPIADCLRRAALGSRRKLLAAAQGVTRAMGTTLTAAYLAGGMVHLLHAGDSRCYLLRKAKLTRLTTDHTIAQRLAEEGAMNDAQAASSPFAHVLWNSVSSAPTSELKPQVVQQAAQPKDVLMLCTDGLTKHIDDKAIAKVLKGKGTSQAKVEKLVTMAREAGGADNITVIVAQVDAMDAA